MSDHPDNQESLGFNLKPIPKFIKVKTSRPYLIIKGDEQSGIYLSVMPQYIPAMTTNNEGQSIVSADTAMVIRLLERIPEDDTPTLASMTWDSANSAYRMQKKVLTLCKGGAHVYEAYNMLARTNLWKELTDQLNQAFGLNLNKENLECDMLLINDEYIQRSKANLVPMAKVELS